MVSLFAVDPDRIGGGNGELGNGESLRQGRINLDEAGIEATWSRGAWAFKRRLGCGVVLRPENEADYVTRSGDDRFRLVFNAVWTTDDNVKRLTPHCWQQGADKESSTNDIG